MVPLVAYRRFGQCVFRSLQPTFSPCRGGPRHTPQITPHALVQSQRTSLPLLRRWASNQPNALAPRVKSSSPSSSNAENEFITIYESCSPRKRILLKAYGVTMCIVLLQAGYFLHASIADAPESSPLKPWMALVAPSFMGAITLRVILSHAKRLVQSVQYSPSSHQVRLNFSKKKALVLPKHEVYTLSKATAETLVEQKPFHHAINPFKRFPGYQVKKNVHLFHGDESYVLEKDGYFAAKGKLLDLYFYKATKPSS